MKSKIFMSLLLLSFLSLCFLPSCDTSQAEPYKEMYEKQVVVNDSLQADMNLLEVRMNLIYTTSIFRIDSLKAVVGQKNILIAQQDSLITNAQRDFQTFLDSLEYDLEHLSAQALQNLINIQKR